MTSILPSFGRDGDRFVVTGRPPAGSILGSSIAIATPGSNEATVIYQDTTRNVLAPQWAPNGEKIIFAVGVFNAFYNGFNSLFLKPGDRPEGGAQIAVINPDGTGFRELTTGPNNSAFPSMAPDGKRFVYRTFGPEGDGLKIMNIETGAISMLTKGYDNFPLWSPRGDLIMFSRLAEGDYDIYTIKPDGTGLKRLTNSHGNDAHQAWSPDGEQIVVARRVWASRTRASTPTRRSRTASSSSCARRHRRAPVDRQPVGGRHAGVAARRQVKSRAERNVDRGHETKSLRSRGEQMRLSLVWSVLIAAAALGQGGIVDSPKGRVHVSVKASLNSHPH